MTFSPPVVFFSAMGVPFVRFRGEPRQFSLTVTIVVVPRLGIVREFEASQPDIRWNDFEEAVLVSDLVPLF